MNREPIKHLSKKQTAELLKNHKWKIYPELKSNLSDVYELEDGRVLLVSRRTQPTATQYHSLDSFLLLRRYWNQKFKALKGNEHILTENFPYQENFINEVPHLVNQLAERFTISDSLLDNSLKSLRHVDKAIKRIGQLESLKEDIFPLLIAYVGEVIKQQTGGCWQIRCVTLRSIVVWEPLIIAKNEREFLPFYIIYKQLYENLPFSLEGAVTGYISEGFRHCSVD